MAPQPERGFAVQGMNHFTILAEDLHTTVDFYKSVLGLTEGYRPELPFPGAWLYVGEQALLHVIAGRPLPEPRAGVLDHMAFSATDLRGSLAHLKRRNIEYNLIQQVGSRIWQVFFLDPNGAKVELNFDPSEAP